MSEETTITRDCKVLNPGLWARFLERRQQMLEPEPSGSWTSPAVQAWLDLYKNVSDEAILRKKENRDGNRKRTHDPEAQAL